MKWGLALTLMWLMTACAPDSGRDAGPALPKPTPAPGPGRRALPQWGGLECQKRGACRDSVLNQDFDQLARFLARKRVVVGEGDFRVFGCGRVLSKAWESEIGGYDSGVDEFLLSAFELKTCEIKGNYQDILENYFNNHEEFKNEVH